MKLSTIIAILALTILLSLPALAAPSLFSKLSCRTATACAASEVQAFNYAGITHAAMPNSPGGEYANKVCCSANGVSLTNSCDAKYNKTILLLSGSEHAQIPPSSPSPSDYQNKVCLSSNTENINVICTYEKECIASQTCIASISSTESGSSTNLHVANCSTDLSQAYADKICCHIGNFSDKTIVNGTVYDFSGAKVAGANVSFYYPNDIIHDIGSNVTDNNGYYWINLSKYVPAPYLLLNSIVVKPGYAYSGKENLNITFNKTNTVNFNLSNESTCMPDCTMSNDNLHTCNPDCEGINGCAYSPESKIACTVPRQVRGARRVINENQESQTVLYCCSASPIVEQKSTNTSISCPGKEMVKMTKIVIIDGEPVKMNVVACSDRK